MFQEMLDFIHAKPYKLDGVQGHILVDKDYHGTGTLSVIHCPSRGGKSTKAYLDIKHKLGDDYFTDLTWSDRLVDIAIELGFSC